MAIGDTITQPIPAVSTAGTSYASQLVEFLREVKARLEAKVALTSLVASFFDLSNNGIGNASYIGLYEQTTLPSSPIGSLQRYGGELYYVSPSGAVRITSGGGLDVVAANGISGDYAAPAAFSYDLGALEYFAYSNDTSTPKQWARVGAQGFDIYGTLGSLTRVRLTWGGGASYTLTLPTAPPASLCLLRMNASGDVVHAGAIDEEVTLATNRSVAISGTAKYKHGTKSIRVPTLAMLANVAFGAGPGTTGGVPGAVQASSSTIYYPLLGIPADAVVTKVVVRAATVPGASVTFDLARSIDWTSGDDPSFADFGLSVSGSTSSTITDINTSTPLGPLWVKCSTGGSSLKIIYFQVEYEVN